MRMPNTVNSDALLLVSVMLVLPEDEEDAPLLDGSPRVSPSGEE